MTVYEACKALTCAVSFLSVCEMFRKHCATFWVTHFYITTQVTLLAFPPELRNVPSLSHGRGSFPARLFNIWEKVEKKQKKEECGGFKVVRNLKK